MAAGTKSSEPASGTDSGAEFYFDLAPSPSVPGHRWQLDPWRQRDDTDAGFMPRVVMFMLVAYLVTNRIIPDTLIVPIGISIRPSEVVMIFVLVAWLLWMYVDPHPLPTGLLGASGLLVLVLLGVAPFLHAPSMTGFMMNGSERGLFRLFLIAALFLAAYHIGFRASSGKRLLVWVLGVTIAQGILALVEWFNGEPVRFLFDFSEAIGLVFDPNGVRPELLESFQRNSGEFRAVASAPHPIVLSAVLALGILIGALWIAFASSRRTAVLLGLAVMAMILALPLPNSRTGFVMLALVVPVVGVAMIRQLPRLVPWSLAAVVVLGLAFVISPQTPRLLLDSVTDSGEDPNTQIRIERLDRVPELLAERPLLGAGYLTHDVEVQLFDNAYNMGVIEFGIVGMAAVLMFFFVAAGRAWRGVANADPSDVILPIAALTAVLCILTGGLTFDAWTFDQFFPTAMIVMGVGLGRTAVILRQRAEGELQ